MLSHSEQWTTFHYKRSLCKSIVGVISSTMALGDSMCSLINNCSHSSFTPPYLRWQKVNLRKVLPFSRLTTSGTTYLSWKEFTYFFQIPLYKSAREDMVSVFCSLVNEINFLTLCPGNLEGEERGGGEWDDQLQVSNYKRDDLPKLTRIHISL